MPRPARALDVGGRISEYLPPAAVKARAGGAVAGRGALQGKERVFGHVGCFCHKLVKAVAEHGQRAERGDGHDQPLNRRHQCEVDAFGQIRRTGGALRLSHFAEGDDHTHYGAQQAEHGGNVGDDREVLNLANQPGSVLSQRVFDRLPRLPANRLRLQRDRQRELPPGSWAGLRHNSAAWAVRPPATSPRTSSASPGGMSTASAEHQGVLDDQGHRGDGQQDDE